MNDCGLIQAMQSGEVTDCSELRALFIEELHPKCPRHAETTVVRCAAAEPNNDVRRVVSIRRQQQFPEPERCGGRWITFVRIEAAKSSYFRQIEHGQSRVRDPSKPRIHWSASRITHARADPLTATRLANDLRSSFTTIGDRQEVDLCRGQALPNTGSNVLGNFSRTETPLVPV